MIFHKNIAAIADKYDYFILDLWGVIHDGAKTYPGVLDSLKHLRKLNKKVCFLSNAPRRSAKVAELLSHLGIGEDLYDFIITSGEATYLYLQSNRGKELIGSPNNNVYRYYYIGPQKDADLLNGLGYEEAADASLADFAVITGFEDGNYNIDEKLPQLRAAAQNNLTMICVNPDLVVIKQSGEELLCAGVLALEYQKLGGKVAYFGKPYNLVYEQVFQLFSIRDKTRILAVGDGIETDILGANKNQIDSALIAGGILANDLKVKYGQFPDADLMQKICDKYQSYPTFILGGL